MHKDFKIGEEILEIYKTVQRFTRLIVVFQLYRYIFPLKYEKANKFHILLKIFTFILIFSLMFWLVYLKFCLLVF